MQPRTLLSIPLDAPTLFSFPGGGGEVVFDGMAFGSGEDSDEEMAVASPSPPAAPPAPPAGPLLATPGGAGDTLPDVRALADALREPLDPVGLEVRGQGWYQWAGQGWGIGWLWSWAD